MTKIQKAIDTINEFLRESQVCSAENPDGIYDNVNEKRELCEKFDEIRLFVENRL